MKRTALEWTAFAETAKRAVNAKTPRVVEELCDGVLEMGREVTRMEGLLEAARRAEMGREVTFGDAMEGGSRPASPPIEGVDLERRRKKAEYMREFRQGKRRRAKELSK